MAKIPKFKSEAEERAFWETHDSTEYWDDTEEAPSFEISEELSIQIQGRRQKKRLLTMRIGQREIDVAKAIAQKKGLDYQTLMRLWMLEGIQREQTRNQAQEAEPLRAKRNTLEKALGLLATSQPAPSDAEIQQWLAEHRMEKDG